MSVEIRIVIAVCGIFGVIEIVDYVSVSIQQGPVGFAVGPGAGVGFGGEVDPGGGVAVLVFGVGDVDDLRVGILGVAAKGQDVILRGGDGDGVVVVAGIGDGEGFDAGGGDRCDGGSGVVVRVGCGEGVVARLVALGGYGRDTARAARRGLCAVGQAVFIIVAPFPIGIDGGAVTSLRGELAGLAEGERDIRRVD